MIKFTGADPGMTLWKKVWCFYYSYYCDVDLIAEAGKNADDANEMKPVSNDAEMKPAADGYDAMDDVDMEEAAAILRLQQNDENDDSSDTEDDSQAGNDTNHNLILDSTSNSFDGKRSWTKVRDLLMEIKQNNHQLWEECCSLGVNNCSERKLESHMDQVQRFFDLQGRGPNQKIRGKKLRVEVGADESVHFLDGDENSFAIEYAKPVKFCDKDVLGDLIQLVDKANSSIGVDESLESNEDANLPANIFNESWRKKRRNFELGERLHKENLDPVYNERRDKLRKRLPAFEMGDDFCKRVFENDVVVLVGATGCGKTTQLPQILMEAAAKLMHEQHSGLAENDKRQLAREESLSRSRDEFWPRA